MYLWFGAISSDGIIFSLCDSIFYKAAIRRGKINGKSDGFAKNAFAVLSHEVKIASSEIPRRARGDFLKKFPKK